ncbi:MAG: hypothetical protein JWL90_2281 [Chthoniobacteraceae bacterium]|nr:hypothetical protein [Chthoniobacteraceae bacterium]
MTVKILRSALFLILLASVSARAEDKIWSAVVIASNVGTPREAPAQLLPVINRLKRVFGYNQFEILGSTTTTIDDQVERWLIPTEHFWLNVKARHASAKEARGGYLLNLQLFHDKRQLVETEAKLAPDSPLFIRGPLHARGQILIVLQVQPPAN